MRVLWSAALLVVAGIGVASVYAGALAPVAVVLAVAVASAVVWGGARLGLGAATPALLVVVVAAGVGWAMLGGTTGDALPRLLTSARPVPATGALLAPVAVVTALVAAVVTAVGGLLAPVVGAAVLYAGVQLLSAGTADRHGVLACCLLALTVFGWSGPIRRAATGAAWRPPALVPLVAALAVAGGGAALIGGGAFDPARHVTPPTVRLTAASPLTLYASWTSDPSVEIFRARVDGTTRLHLATLSQFTGATWQVDDRYRQVGLATDPELPVGSRRTAVRGTVQLTRLGSIWLPSAGVATSASVRDAVVDGDDGTLALASGARSGLRYDLTASVDAPPTALLQVAATPSSVPSRYVALPGVPVAFTTYARKAVRGASTPLEEAVALEHAVSTDRVLSATAASGTSYQRLSTFLFGPAGTPGAQQGSAEQFAAAFAVLARAVGLPTRLVVGFDVPSPAASGTSVVHGSDATVWPEVYFAGAGWAAFAPTPGSSGTDSSVRDAVLQNVASNAAGSDEPPPIKAGASGRPVAGHAVDGGVPRAVATASSTVPTWLVGLVVALAVVMLLVAALMLLRRRRSARHRRGGAIGAWAEFVDVLHLAGLRPASSVPAPAVAASFDERHAGSGARAVTLALAADRAAFAPGGFRGDASLWRDLRVLRRRARSSVPRYRRVLWPLDPRPLLRRSGA